MKDENKTASDQTGEEVENHLNDIQDKAIKKTTEKGTKQAIRVIKHASKALVKALAYAIKAVVAVLGPYLIIIFFALIIFYLAWDMVFETRGKEQSYQMQTTQEDNVVVKDDKGDYNNATMSRGNKTEKAFYTIFSDKSYYMVIKDDKTLYKPDDTKLPKGEDGKPIVDKYEREKMFYLNPNILYTLDEFLNNNEFRFPEQFVQPVAYDADTFTLKQLADEKGNLKIQSQAYDQKTTKPIKDKKVDGVWDYGLASILHYVDFREKKEVEGKYSQEEYWDESSQSVQTRDIDEKYNKTLEDKQVWMIDKVVSPAGTISNKIKCERVKGNVYKDSEVYWEGDKNGKNVKLRKYITGNYYDTIPQYEGEPDTSQITGSKYYRDYFNHYSALVPKDCMSTFNFKSRTGKSEDEIDKILEADKFDPTNASGANVDMAQFKLGSGASADSYKMALQYLPAFQKWGETYGVDPYLLLAQACQESGGNHESSLPGGKDYNGYGCGIMQVESPGQVVTSETAYNFKTHQNETIKISGVDDVRNVDDNIRVGAMELANRMKDVNSNVLLGLQGYNMGLGGIQNVVRASGMSWEDAKNNPANLSWTNNRSIQAGDKQYIEHVLSYYASPNDKVPYVMKEDGSKVSANGSIETGSASGLSISGGGGIFDKFASWVKQNINKLKEKFKEIFPDHPDKLDVNRIEYKHNIPEKNVDDVLNMTFVMEEKKYFSEYGPVTDEFWKEKFSQLFSNPLGAYWQSLASINSADFFPNGFQSPVPGNTTISKGFGNANNGSSTEFHGGVDVAVPQGTPIYAVADGTVTKAENNSNDKSLGKYIQIQHTPDVYTNYGSLDTLSVKVGDKVTKGQQIGTSGNSGSCGGYVLHFELIKNNQHVDGSWVITGQGVSQGGNASGPLSIAGSEKAQKIYQSMAQYLGTAYSWGGNKPSTGFDCSGLMEYCFGLNGVQLPRTSEEQMAQSKRVSISDAQPGDLLFWHSGGHVGMYLGNGQYIHSPHTGDVVKISPVDWSTVCAVGRFLN